MTEKMQKEQDVRFSLLGVAMALGLVLGGLIGLALDNMIIFSGGGMILGLSVGLALEKRRLG